jgi:membrane protein YdbS with pleckstrin-like domain
MADPAKYLLPTERVAIKIRRHWAVLAGDTALSIILLAIGVLIARLLDSVEFAQTVLIWFCVFVVARWAWKIFDWYNETLVVTDKRLLLLTGIFYRNVAIMPLVKVTDLTYHRSANGMAFGYGKFVVESAGQDQALSTIDFVPHPDQLYRQISDLLFGGDKGSPGALVTEAQRQAEEESERQARRRFGRRFTRRRRSDGPDERPPGGSTPSQLDAILADRDTLLADRDDPDGRDDGGWQRPPGPRPGPSGPSGPGYDPPNYGDPSYGRRSYGEQSYDEPGSGQGDHGQGWYGEGPYGEREYGEPRYGDRAEDPYRRPADPTARLPRIHEPRRGDSTGRNEVIRPEGPLPPPRRPRDLPPPGTDPADD